MDIVKRSDLDERSAAKEEAKHVGHDVVTDHTGNGNDEPSETKKFFKIKAPVFGVIISTATGREL